MWRGILSSHEYKQELEEVVMLLRSWNKFEMRAGIQGFKGCSVKVKVISVCCPKIIGGDRAEWGS